MTSLVGVPTRQRAAVPGTFPRSMMAAAARGLGLVGAAVLIGVLLLRATDDLPGGGGTRLPDVGVITVGDETTTTTQGLDLGLRSPSQVTVIVFNAARKPGLAGAVTDQLKQLGYQTLEPSNAPTEVETVVYFKPGFEREATALAPQVSPSARAEPYAEGLFAGTEQADLIIRAGTNFDSATTPTTA
ncbi:MAG TPA: LytR C-terminal domain-containing protein [Acidimicrobiia bacterium]|nr:LytR C-terminal domain-containing protein [Acidimicrobiia bacterium]